MVAYRRKIVTVASAARQMQGLTLNTTPANQTTRTNMKSSLKTLAAISALALGLVTSNTFAQPGAGAPGAGGPGAGGPGAGRGGAGGRGGAAAVQAPPTMEALTAAVTGLSADQQAKIKTELDTASKAYTEYTAALTKYTDARTKNLAAISALLTADQKTAFDTLTAPAAGGRGGRGGAGGAAPGGGAGGAGGRGGRGGRGGAAPGAPAPGA